MDRGTLSLLQDSTNWLEKQCATQFVAEQMFPEGRKGTGKLNGIVNCECWLDVLNFIYFVQNMGKGSLWRVEQQYKQNLIQALTRSSYHPCTNSLEKSPFKVSPRPTESPPGFKVCLIGSIITYTTVNIHSLIAIFISVWNSST